MSRPLRITMPNLPFHILNRGNARQNVFRDDEDFEYYLKLIKRYKKEFQFKLFHFVLMPNHVHFQMEPIIEGSISKIMQRLTLAHTWYFNKKYHSAGHVWQGRFKSSLIDKENYFLHCGMYIELNPARAGLVKNPEDWRFSSYNFYAFGKTDSAIKDILDCDPFYLELDSDDFGRQKNYRDMFREAIMQRDFLDEIRKKLDRGVLGGESFLQKVKEDYKIALPRARGRPREEE